MVGECKRCARCCIDATFPFAYVRVGDEKMYQDAEKWFSFHRCKMFIKDKQRFLLIPIRCSNLQVDNSCAIYEDRLEICRRFECKKEMENG